MFSPRWPHERRSIKSLRPAVVALIIHYNYSHLNPTWHFLKGSDAHFVGDGPSVRSFHELPVRFTPRPPLFGVSNSECVRATNSPCTDWYMWKAPVTVPTKASFNERAGVGVGHCDVMMALLWMGREASDTSARRERRNRTIVENLGLCSVTLI